MKLQEKIDVLLTVYNTFDKDILSKPLSRVRFVVTTPITEIDDKTVLAKNTDEIKTIIKEFNNQAGLKPLDFFVEDVRLAKTLGGHISIQLLDINVVG
ncbi:MAG: hypothetical protein Q7T12_01955 [Flavobacterium sp.]|nr:hypothetical protein [Flavobacterium sp.]